SRNGSFTVTINWCGWSEVGMAVRAINYFSEVYGAKIETTTAVSPSEGIDIFLRIIGSGHPRVAVSPQELGIAIEHDKSFLDIAHGLEPVKLSNPRPDLPTPYAAPRNEQEQEIAEIWQNLLGIEQVGIHDNFFELGGHSLLATQVISRLRATFKVELQLHQFFEIQTIAGLSESIEKAKNSGSKLQAPAIKPISRKSRTRLAEGGKMKAELKKSH
ncbi:MAG: polyketide synthase, partial [Deltaproteobacteria bacterium]|nr:polyketide synthase [Deltaproteobacteria bacterium]